MSGVNSKHNEIKLDQFEEYGLNHRDVSLIQKYTEHPALEKNTCLALDELKQCIYPPMPPQVGESKVVGRRVENQQHLVGYSIGDYDELHLGLVEDIGKAVEVNFDKNIGIKKRILANKYRPHYAAPQHLRKQLDEDRAQKVKSYAKHNHVREQKQSLDKRSKVHKKYTKVDEERKKKVREEIVKNSKRLVPRHPDYNFCRYCHNQGYCDHCDQNPYVIEQVRAKMLKSRKTTINIKKVMATDCFEEIEAEVKENDSEGRLKRLMDVISMMDCCLSEQVEVQVREQRPKSKEKVAMSEACVQVSPPEEFIAKVPQSTKSERITSPPKQKQIRLEKHGRKARMIERKYELYKDSYEVSDIISHIPSNIFNLNVPLEIDDDTPADEAAIEEDSPRFLTTKKCNQLKIEEKVVEFEKYGTVRTNLDDSDYF